MWEAKQDRGREEVIEINSYFKNTEEDISLGGVALFHWCQRGREIKKGISKAWRQGSSNHGGSMCVVINEKRGDFLMV